MKPEQRLQNAVCNYLKAQYPQVMFMISPSGIKLTMGQAVNLKRNQNPSKGWPDLLIMQPKYMGSNIFRCGLFIELKPDGTVLYKKDGTLRKNEHIENQYNIHTKLLLRHYHPVFAVGFDEAKNIIDSYLNEKEWAY